MTWGGGAAPAVSGFGSVPGVPRGQLLSRSAGLVAAAVLVGACGADAGPQVIRSERAATSTIPGSISTPMSDTGPATSAASATTVAPERSRSISAGDRRYPK